MFFQKYAKTFEIIYAQKFVYYANLSVYCIHKRNIPKNMKLKQEVVDKLNNPPTRRRISAKLKSCGDQAIYKHLRGNSDNGRLTKMDALKAIAEETGLTIDQLLE